MAHGGPKCPPQRTVQEFPSATLYIYLLQIGVRGYRRFGGGVRSGGERRENQGLGLRDFIARESPLLSMCRAWQHLQQIRHSRNTGAVLAIAVLPPQTSRMCVIG